MGPERDEPIQYKINFVSISHKRSTSPHNTYHSLHIGHRRTVPRDTERKVTLVKQGQTSGRPKRKPSEGLGWAAVVSH